MAQLVRAPPCHGGGRGFEPLPGRFMKNFIMKNCGILAQLGEHLPYKQRVTGSSPVGPITTVVVQLHMARWLNWLERPVHTREVESSSLSLATEEILILRISFFMSVKWFLFLKLG